MGCTPRVRHVVKSLFPRRQKRCCHRLILSPQSAAVGEAEAGSAGEQPARNSQLETHRLDEPGAAVHPVAPNPLILDRVDRFPYASENSSFRSRFSDRRSSRPFKLDWGAIAKRRVQPFAIVDRLDETPYSFSCLRQVSILRSVHLFIL